MASSNWKAIGQSDPKTGNRVIMKTMSAYPFAAVLFDLDGVVIDTMPVHRRIWQEFAASKGRGLSAAEVMALDGRRAADVVAAIFPQASAAEVLALAKERELCYQQELLVTEIPLVSGVREFLAELARLGIPCVLATSAIACNVEVVLVRTGLCDAFGARVTAEDVLNGKPDPGIYLEAARRANQPPGRCLVIEDALPGVRSAKAAGTLCLGLTTSETPASLLATGADWTAPDFQHLPVPLLAR